MYTCIASVHLTTFIAHLENFFFYTLSLPFLAVSIGMAHISGGNHVRFRQIYWKLNCNKFCQNCPTPVNSLCKCWDVKVFILVYFQTGMDGQHEILSGQSLAGDIRGSRK